MPCFDYRDGVLHVEDVALPALVQALEPPFYCYSVGRLRENYGSFAAPLVGHDASIHFAIKAAANQAVIHTLADCGAGADIVSVGELLRALHVGIPPDRIVFSGIGKSREELRAALVANVGQINVESVPELRLISELANARHLKANVALRINPEVQAATLAKIATGHKGAKFGIPLDLADEALALVRTLPGIAFRGFAMHIGSHLNDYAALREGLSRGAELVIRTRASGLDVERFDCGGGVPIAYDGEAETATFESYMDVINETVGKLGCHLSFEPGRRLVGDAAILVTRVIHVKDLPGKRFVIVDAGMNDLARPAIYGARHSIKSVQQTNNGTTKATVVGPICESSDTFGDDFDLPTDIAAGDLLAIFQAGAYGATMAGTYNARPLVPEMMVSGREMAVVRRRVSVAEQIEWESVPAWL